LRYSNDTVAQPNVDASLKASIDKHESYIKADPHNAPLWVALGDLYHRAGRFEEAIASFERSLMEAPQASAAKSRIASVQISQHRFPEAEAMLRELLREEPQSAALAYNLGLAQFYQDKWREAQASFDRALSLGLKSRDSYAYLTRSLHHLGRTREAIESCEQWLAQSPDDQARAYLSLLEMDEGNMARAHELAQEVLARDPENLNASTVAGSYSVEQQDMDAAERFFNNVLRREPDSGRAWLGMGLVHLYQQKHAEAVAALEKAVQLMPAHAGTVVALGWARLAARDARGAERTFREAVAVDRNFAEAHGGLASALALQGRVDEARQAVRHARGLDRANFGGRFAQAVLLVIHGKKERAQELLANVLQQAPAKGAQPLIEHLRVYGAKQLSKAPPPRSGAPDGGRR
jgi:tetratricopeptide (TPR) repeat protein